MIIEDTMSQDDATNNKAEAVAAVKRLRRNDAVMDVWLFDLSTRSHIRVD